VQMKKFAFEQYSGMNEAMWESALVSMVANGAIAQGLEEDVWMSLDALLSMDAAFDFQGISPSKFIPPLVIGQADSTGPDHIQQRMLTLMHIAHRL
jgi:hypothetical protein